MEARGRHPATATAAAASSTTNASVWSWSSPAAPTMHAYGAAARQNDLGTTLRHVSQTKPA